MCPKFYVGDSRNILEFIKENSIDLVVTSPPYPMIAMWDNVFCEMLPDEEKKDTKKWTEKNAFDVFELMHQCLDIVWRQLKKITKKGSIVVINIGDATRSINGCFFLFPNAARATIGMIHAGFTPLPNIYWKKPTNKPNAFLGSGFYPVNAYVTLDCEHILIFRNGDKRKFPPKDSNREACKFSREERNLWFSQIWSIPGSVQKIIGGRRSAAFPREIPYRLIRMFSVLGDMVLDPFVGTGTTALVASQLGRQGIGIDIDKKFIKEAKHRKKTDF